MDALASAREQGDQAAATPLWLSSSLPRHSVTHISVDCCPKPQVGKHGIIINFTDPDLQCARSATYLPEVAPEQGWSHKDAVLSLIRKAGYDGHVSSSLLSSIKLTRYQSTVKGVSYAQYAAWKGSQGAGVVAGAEDLEVALA